MKNDTDKLSVQRGEQKDQRDLTQKYATQLHLKCYSFCFYDVSVILDYIFYNFMEICKINSLNKGNLETKMVLWYLK